MSTVNQERAAELWDNLYDYFEPTTVLANALDAAEARGYERGYDRARATLSSEYRRALTRARYRGIALGKGFVDAVLAEVHRG